MFAPESPLALPALFVGLAVVYSLLLAYACFRWSRMARPAKGSAAAAPLFVSVLVVVRNEEKNICSLINDLWQQNYPRESWELLIVDDHSSDSTPSIVRGLAKESPVPMRFLQMEGIEGKKQGLRWGISQLKGEAVLVTDGDCRLGSKWLQSYAGQFEAGSFFISGPVTFTAEQNLFEEMQTIEFASLVGAGAVMLTLGKPGMCNAANMGFLAAAYRQAELLRTDYGIPSGDDEFLLQAIYQRHPHKVSFLKSREAVVHTYAQPDWPAFYQQRKRWAGKWRHHKQAGPAFTALGVFAFYCCWLLLAVSLLAQGAYLYFFAGALVKFLGESLFLYAVLHSFGKQMKWLPFAVLHFLYPAYVLFFGLAVNRGGFSWKERTYNYAKK